MPRRRIPVVLVTAALLLASILAGAPTALSQVENPDLVVTDISWPSSPDEGENIVFTATIENQGDGDAGAFDVAFNLVGEDFSSTNTHEDGVESGGVATVESDAWTVTRGSHTINATVDPDDDVDEGEPLPSDADSPKDNSREESFDVGPDLRVADVQITPGSPIAGEEVTVNATFRNDGDADVKQDIDVLFEIVADGGEVVHERSLTVPGLNFGDQIKRDSGGWTSETGTYNARVSIDPGGAVDEANEDNNVRNTQLQVSAAVPDLNVTKIIADPATPSPGEATFFAAQVLNDGPGTVTHDFHVRFQVDGTNLGADKTISKDLEAGDGQTVSSDEWTAEEGEHIVTVIADPGDNDVKDEVSEENNEKDLILRIGHDLIVNVSTRPAQPVQGQQVTLVANVTNQGTQSIDTPFTVNVSIQDGFGREANISQLAAFTEQAVEIGPWEPTEDTTYTLEAEVDVNDTVEEINENNNTDTRPVHVLPPRPDLDVREIALSPEAPDPGEETTIETTIRNRGTEDVTEDTRVEFTVDGNSVDEATVSASSADPWSPGEDRSIQGTWSSPTVGEHTINVTADADEVVEEIHEENNLGTLEHAVGPNLDVTELTWTPSSPVAGTDTTFKATLSNNGTSDAVSVDVQFTVGGSGIGTATADSVPAGSTVTVSSDTWSAGEGQHVAEAIVDPDDDVPELDEADNQIARTLTVEPGSSDDGDGDGDGDGSEDDGETSGPDLVFGSLTPTADAAPGEEVSVRATVENAGDEDADAFSVTFELDGEPLGERDVTELAAGSTATVTSPTWTAEEGEQTARAILDPDDDVQEADETNNEHERTLTFGDEGQPNLRVSNVSWTPESASVGDAITFEATIENAGQVAASGVNVRFTVNGTEVGASTLQGALGAGASSTVQSDAWNATPGNHTLSVVVDPADTVAESSETDNTRSRTIEVSPGDEPGLIPGPGAVLALAAAGVAALVRRRR